MSINTDDYRPLEYFMNQSAAIPLGQTDASGLSRELISRGMALLSAKVPNRVEFVKDPAVDALLDPRGAYPHAFVMGCLANRQVRAATAWHLPAKVRSRLAATGRDFDVISLAGLTDAEWVRCLTIGADGVQSALHRLPAGIAGVLHSGLHRIVDYYGGDAQNIWNDQPSSATLVSRFLQFNGVGPKIACMAANILVRDFRVPVGDYRCIDISADRHVLRVMGRLGLVDEDASPDVVIYRARDLNPDFPGVFDLVVWQIGSDFCHEKHPDCAACPVAPHCRHAKSLT